MITTLAPKQNSLKKTHCGLAIYIKKYLEAKERIMETQIFQSAKKIIIFKKPSKRNQNPSRYYNSITNL
jgi:hypothetical protein